LVREASVSALKKKFFKGQQISELDASGFYSDSDKVKDSAEDTVLVTMDDFRSALRSIHPSVTDRDRQKYEKLNKRMGWTIIQQEVDDETKKEQETT
jgi:ribosome biogenesis ATPase